jgi:hypothetical protein
MGPIRCPEKSVRDYHSTLSNTPEESRSQHFSFSDVGYLILIRLKFCWAPLLQTCNACSSIKKSAFHANKKNSVLEKHTAKYTTIKPESSMPSSTVILLYKFKVNRWQAHDWDSLIQCIRVLSPLQSGLKLAQKFKLVPTMPWTRHLYLKKILKHL